MANPQIDNGYTKIANEVIEALAKTRIPGECMQVLWTIFRKTYGWNKKEDMISFTQISQMTGIKRQHVSRAISKLIDMKIVTKNGNSSINLYRFNKHYEEWVLLPKKVTVLPKKVTPVPNNGDKSVTKKGYNKRKKETITKENNIDTREIKFRDTLTPFVEIYGEEMIKAFYDYWREPNRSKTKMRWEQEKTWDINLRLKRWERNQDRWHK